MFVTTPKASDVIAIPVIPLRPAFTRKSAHHICAACVPRFRNYLCIVQNGIFLYLIQNWRKLKHKPLLTSAKNRSKIKSKSIYMILHHPIAQTVNNKVAHHRMIALERIAAAAVIEIIFLVAVDKHIIHAVVKTTEAQRHSVFIAFRSVIEHYV